MTTHMPPRPQPIYVLGHPRNVEISQHAEKVQEKKNRMIRRARKNQFTEPIQHFKSPNINRLEQNNLDIFSSLTQSRSPKFSHLNRNNTNQTDQDCPSVSFNYCQIHGTNFQIINVIRDLAPGIQHHARCLFRVRGTTTISHVASIRATASPQ